MKEITREDFEELLLDIELLCVGQQKGPYVRPEHELCFVVRDVECYIEPDYIEETVLKTGFNFILSPVLMHGSRTSEYNIYVKG